MFYNISQSLHHTEDPWSSIIHVFVWLDQECLNTLFFNSFTTSGNFVRRQKFWGLQYKNYHD